MPSSNRKTKILFVYSALPSFVRADLKMLQRHFDVKAIKVETFFVPQRKKDPAVFLRLVKGILWADLVYTWFADVNAFFIVFFCRLLHRKSLIVVGGYDIVYIPEIDYGTLKSPIGRVRTKFVLNYATKILPFSNYAKERVLSITKNAHALALPLACDVERLKPTGQEKEDLVITVCYVDEMNIKRKGLKTFVESAKLLPQLKFALIGPHEENSANRLKEEASPNIEFTGYVEDEELPKWYQKAKVYCQLSYEEGFGVALIEAMACECIPVVSSKARVLRETVGDFGYYVPYGDLKATVEAIEKASSKPESLGRKARKRVIDYFSIERREKSLFMLVNDIVR